MNCWFKTPNEQGAKWRYSHSEKHTWEILRSKLSKFKGISVITIFLFIENKNSLVFWCLFSLFSCFWSYSFTFNASHEQLLAKFTACYFRGNFKSVSYFCIMATFGITDHSFLSTFLVNPWDETLPSFGYYPPEPVILRLLSGLLNFLSLFSNIGGPQGLVLKNSLSAHVPEIISFSHMALKTIYFLMIHKMLSLDLISEIQAWISIFNPYYVINLIHLNLSLNAAFYGIFVPLKIPVLKPNPQCTSIWR